MPQILRMSLAMQLVLEQLPIFIGEDERIVGGLCGKPDGLPYFPEYGASEQFIESALADAPELDPILTYWRGRTVPDLWQRMRPPGVQAEEATGTFVCGVALNGLGHISVNYAKVLEKGLYGLLEEVERRLARLKFEDPLDFRRSIFYQAVSIALKSAMRFAERYAGLAASMAETARHPARRAELLEIAEVCRRVPSQPARTFREALQAFWFTHVLLQIESNGHSVSPGRFDQYMYPYFCRDVEQGRLSRESAAALLEALWVKFEEVRKLYPWDKVGGYLPHQGLGTMQNLMVGGVASDGQDATNELSYMIIETSARVRGIDPSLSIRVHERTPDALLLVACRLAKIGTGHPHFFNDKAVIPALVARGIALEDARNWAAVGCQEIRTSGKDLGVLTGLYVNLLRCLELEVLEGSGSYASFDEFFDAYTRRVERAVRAMAIAANAAELAHREVAPLAFISALVDGCLEQGKSLIEGGATYNFTGCKVAGVPNVADGLAAIRKLIFQEAHITWDQLRTAMRSNFDGREGRRIRHLLLERAPKYGNDNDEVDALACAVGQHVCREVARYQTPRGGTHQAGLYTVATNIGAGAACGATPDGRLAGFPTADNISPAHGRDRKGPTAAINSVDKLDHISAPEGTGLTLNFAPATFQGEDGARTLASLVRSHFDKLGMHVQFNMRSLEMLRDAQRHPEKYPNLIVRVSGFSARFTQLDRQTQEDIIARTEHAP